MLHPRPVRHQTDVERLDTAWSVYLDVLRTARGRGLELAIGGGFAVAAYTVYRQSTKDIDVYVQPGDRKTMVDIVTEAGLTDYYDVLPYDRKWIYRSHRDDVIVDIMWAMPNQRAQVDRDWLTRGPELDLHGEMVRVLPPEELIWAKLYVLQRDRSDWPDILNLIYATGLELNWDHLINRLEDDAPLLDAVLTIFRWLCPDRAAQFPETLWSRLRDSRHRYRGGIPREELLDTRPWFLPALEAVGQRSC